MSITELSLRRWCGDERLARAAWSRITEPSDRAAESLRRQLGAGPALRVALGAAPMPPPIEHQPDLRAAVRRWSVRAGVVDPERDLLAIEQVGGRLLIPGDDDWPSRLDDLQEDTPVCLWVRGDGSLRTMLSESVALVGSRASTRYGELVAEDLAINLSRDDVTVVSGAAFGIDAAAHRGALAVHKPTVAVLACGVDRSYPLAHAVLLDRIAEDGLIVSELPPGSTPTRVRFLDRNRLIAALSLATVVVEAGWRSGALNTARHAMDTNRELLVVPGPVSSPASAGCHRLLRMGATCVTNASEILEAIRPVGESPGQEPALRPRPYDLLRGTELRIWEALPVRGWRSVAQVSIGAGVEHDTTVRVLHRLSVDGRAGCKRGSGGELWRRAAPEIA